MPEKLLKCLCCQKEIKTNLTTGENALLNSEATHKVFPFFKLGYTVCPKCSELLPKSETLVVMPFPMKDKFISTAEMEKLLGKKRR